MKTTLPLRQLILGLLISVNVYSQSADSLVFKNPTLLTGAYTALNAGAEYLFTNVRAGVDAKVKIDSLVNGAQITKIDDNTGGLGYLNAFQPEIRIVGGSGECYAVFSIRFVQPGTNNPVLLNNVKATSVDIDGNLTLKELVEVNMGGGTATFMSSTLDISVLQILGNKFRAQNILGIEKNGIDTSALGNMFTVSRSGISGFRYRAGAVRLLSASSVRQYSMYMKGFTYSNGTTLPIKLETFTATLNNSKVDLKWTTASEINASHFMIEKSLDGKNFFDIGMMFAYGNTSNKSDYAFSDNNLKGQTGLIYYRLRSVDVDLGSQFSEIRVIRVAKASENNISILTYPNPATNELRVTIPNNWQNKKVTYELFNGNGVTARQSVAVNASQTENINISSLSPGFYIIKVSCNGEMAQQKIIKN